MLDNQLIKIFLPIIQNGLIDFGLTNVIVRQSNQPTQQGANSGQVVYFYKIGDYRYGFPGYHTYFDLNNLLMKQTYLQHYETTWQINAMAIQDPSNVDSLTASDLVNIVSEILQQDSTVIQFANNDIGILRITDVRNPYFVDDKDNFEASPSFDFTLSHKQIKETIIPIISETQAKIYQI